jgi:hypothetical protein
MSDTTPTKYVLTPGEHIRINNGHDTIVTSTGVNYITGGLGGNDGYIINQADLIINVANGIHGVQDYIFEFGGAQTWNPTNNDFIAFTDFASNSTLVQLGAGYTNPTTGYFDANYQITDGITGAQYIINVQSVDGLALGTGDYAFYPAT